MERAINIVCRVKGGLGNQLFCYAAARRLALANGVELLIDDVSGFSRDRQYHRQYMLDCFHIPARKATASERLEPLARYRRAAMKWWFGSKPFEARRYLAQEGIDFDSRLLALKVNQSLYLDGLWQSEGYFKDIAPTIREDLRIIPPADSVNLRVAEEIAQCEAVAVHVRWFDAPGQNATYNIPAPYYRRAMALMEEKITSPRYFVFSDDPAAAKKVLPLPEDRTVYISHNRGDENAYADLWLMRQCRHFITANSTFSWWGAWLGSGEDKLVVTPDLVIDGKAAWGFRGLIPAEWTRV